MPYGVSESFILGLIASGGGLITLIFTSLRKSRCEQINCCWGGLSCKRELLEGEADEEKKNATI